MQKGAGWKTSMVPRVSMISKGMPGGVVGRDWRSVGEPKIAFLSKN